MPRIPGTSRHTRLVLATFAKSPMVWRYGYDLGRETGLKAGTLYPMLIRLADQGLLISEWQAPERPGRPPRHAYRLTREGVAFAHAQAEAAADRPVASGALA